MSATRAATSSPSRRSIRAVLFLLVAAACVTPWVSPPIALALGVALALTAVTAFEAAAKRYATLLIQCCVVLLGFRMDLRYVAEAGAFGLVFATGTIIGTFTLGWQLGKRLRLERNLTLLLASGTAICGGSAIAAVGASIRARGAEMAVALGTVFVLNAVALYIFPPLGHLLHLSDVQFGTWVGVAIHDTSSVLGAAQVYHAGDPTSTLAWETATVVKLTRVLWIVPVAATLAWAVRRGAGCDSTLRKGVTTASVSDGASGEALLASRDPAAVTRWRPGVRWPVPWFVAFFLVASMIRTNIAALAQVAPTIDRIAGTGMTLALFLIGSGLSRKALAAVGWRPLAVGVLLWIFIATASLVVVRATT